MAEGSTDAEATTDKSKHIIFDSVLLPVQYE
jgi:hypothetical protein